MAGPLLAPTVVMLFPFRVRDPVSGKWTKARYRVEKGVIAVRHPEFTIVSFPSR